MPSGGHYFMIVLINFGDYFYFFHIYRVIIPTSTYLWLGFEVLTAVVMKGTIFWNITPCSPLKINRRFVGGFLLGLFFDPEDGGDIFLRNGG
jgi:hypothetical protein